MPQVALPPCTDECLWHYLGPYDCGNRGVECHRLKRYMPIGEWFAGVLESEEAEARKAQVGAPAPAAVEPVHGAKRALETVQRERR